MSTLISFSTDASRLSNLPAELIMIIAEFLEYECEINSLSRISRRFYHLLNPYLYRNDVLSGRRLAFSWAAAQGHEPTVQNAWKAGAEHTFGDACLAASNGHDWLLKLLLERGVQIEASELKLNGNKLDDSHHFSTTLLANAVERGHESTVRILLELGADINSFLGTGSPLLIQAVRGRHYGIARLLVNAGADLNAGDWWGGTALYHAALQGHTETVKLLLQKGADYDQGRNARLPLPIAVQNDHMDVIECLLAHGAGVDYHVLLNAANDNQASAVELLLRYWQAPLVNKQGQLALLAAGAGLTGTLAKLIDQGWDVRSDEIARTTEEGTSFVTPLTYAAKNGHVDIVRLLLSHGADVDGNYNEDHSVSSPLRHAVRQGHEDVVRVLLESNASLHESEERHILNESIPHDGIFKLLLDHGADLLELDLEAVMLAGDPAKLQILIDAGLEFKLRGSWLDSNWSTSEIFPQVLAKSNEAIVRTVFANGHRPVPIGKRSHPGNGIYLNLAASHDNIALLECLREIGFDARIHSDQSRLLENAATLKDHSAAVATVDWLLQQGVNMESRGAMDRTPLLAVVRNHTLHPEHAARILLDCGADPCYEQNNGDCPLSEAVCHRGNLSLLVDLINAIDRKGNISFDILGTQILHALSMINEEPRPGSKMYRIGRMLNNYWWRKLSERPREEWGPGVSDWAR